MAKETENHQNDKSDIKKTSLIINILPKWAHPYAYLSRIDRPVGIWLLLIPSIWSILLACKGFAGIGLQEITIIILFALGSITMRSAGCIINDLWDKEFDKKVERTASRPLASGEITTKQAIKFLIILLLISLAILLQFNKTTIILGMCSIILVIIYPLMKRWTWWPQIFLGLTFNFGALMGYSAVTGEISISSILLYIAGILWTMGYDTIYAFMDKKDDEIIGIRSTARLLDVNAKPWIAAFYSVTISALILTGILSGANFIFFIIILAGAIHMIWQLTYWKIDNSYKSLKIFKSNRDFGIIIIIAFLFI